MKASRSAFSRLLRVVVLMVAVTSLIFVLWTQSGNGREFMRSFTTDILAETLNAKVRIGAMKVSFDYWPPGSVISVEDVTLENHSEGKFADVGSIRLRPSLLALMTRQSRFIGIEVDNAIVQLRIRDGKLINGPVFKSQNTQSSGDLPFSQISITNSSFEVDIESMAMVQLDGLSAHVKSRRHGAAFNTSTSALIKVGSLDESISEIHLEGAWENEHLFLSEVRLTSENLRLKAEETSVGLSSQTPTVHGDVSLNVNLAFLNDLPVAWSIPSLSGTLKTKSALAFEDGDISAQSVITLENAIVDGFTIAKKFTANIDADKEKIKISNGIAYLVDDGGHAEIEGSIGLSKHLPLRVWANAKDVHFAQLMKQLGVSPNAIVQWLFRGKAVLKGTLSPFNIAGPIHMQSRDFLVTKEAWHSSKKTRVIGVKEAELKGQWRFTAEGLHFTDVTAVLPRSQIDADVYLSFSDHYRVRAKSRSLDLKDATPLLTIPLAGKANVEVNVGGPYRDTSLLGSAQVQDLVFGGFRVGDLESELMLTDGGVVFRAPHVDVNKGKSRYTARDFTLDFRDEGMLLRTKLDANRLHLADVYHVFGYENDERFSPYQGSATGSINVNYTVGRQTDNPLGTLDLDMDMHVLNANLNEFPFDGGSFRGRWHWFDIQKTLAGGNLNVEDLVLKNERGRVNLHGSMNARKLDLRAYAQALPLRGMTPFHRKMPDITGALSALVNIDGTPDNLHVFGEGSLAGVRAKGAHVGDAHFHVELTDKSRIRKRRAQKIDERCPTAAAGFLSAQWKADPPIQTVVGPEAAEKQPMAYLVCGQSLANNIRFDMAVGRNSHLPPFGSLSLIDMPLGRIAAAYVEGRGDPQITLSANATFKGGDIAMPRGEILLSRFDGEYSNLRFSVEPTYLRMSTNSATLEKLLVHTNEGKIEARGTINKRGRISASLDGEIKLRAVENFSHVLNSVRGRVGLHLRLGGDLKKPKLEGEATIKDGAFALGAFPLRIDDIQGLLRIDDRNLAIESLDARIHGGKVQIDGGAHLSDDGLEYRFDTHLRRISLAPQEGIEALFGGDVRVSRTPEKPLPRIEGDILLQRLVYRQTTQLTPSLGQFYRPKKAGEENHQPEDAKLELALSLRSSNPARVENNIVTAEIMIDDRDGPLRIVGNDQQIGALGRLSVQEGTINFRNTGLDIQSGTIELRSKEKIDAHFDMRAATEIRRQSDMSAPSWQISLHAFGTPDDFRIDANSQPQLSDSDIIMLLTLGMTAAEAQQLQAGDLAGSALEAFGRMSGVNDEVRKMLPLIDEFAITSAYSDVTNQVEPQLTIGKRISERVRLSASSGITAETRSIQARLEWALTRGVRLQLFYDNLNRESASSFGNIGTGARWRFEFD